jgi:hypothetical protein
MTNEYEKDRRVRRESVTHKHRHEGEKWKHSKAQPYVRKPLNTNKLLEQLDEEEYDD